MKKNNVIYIDFHLGKKIALDQKVKITFLNKLYINIKKLFKCETSHLNHNKKNIILVPNKRNMS